MRRAALALVLAGCSAKPAEITVHTGRPFLAAIDRGDGWELLPDQEDVVLEVDGPFVLASACGTVDWVEVRAWMATADDRAEWTMPCRQLGGEYFDVRFSFGSSPPSSVGKGASFAGYWFEYFNGATVEVSPQTTDMFVYETAGDRRFVLQRDFEIDRPRLFVADFDRDGRSFATHPVLKDLSAQVIETQLYVEMNGVRAWIRDTDADEIEAIVMPADVLRPGDIQELYAVERMEAQVRWAGGPFGREPVPAVLPDPIPAPTFAISGGVPEVRYVDGRQSTTRSLEAYASEGILPLYADRYWNVDALPGWVLAEGEPGELAFPDVTTIPGWQREWELARADMTVRLVSSGESTKYAGVSHEGGAAE